MVSAFIIGALTAKIDADVPEYSEDTLENVDLTKTYATTTPAQLINSDIEMELRPTENQDYDFNLLVSSNSGPTPKNNPCGNNLGVKLAKTGKVFCNLFIIDLGDSYLQGGSAIPHISLMFYSTDEPLFQLSTPIFVKPATYESSETQDQFKKWVVDNKVGTLTSDNLKKIKDIGNRKPVKLDFEWLSQLLELGISKDISKPDDEDFYYTRPIVVSKEDAEDIITAIDSLDSQK